MPGRRPGGRTSAARARARSRTIASNALRGAIASTRPQSTRLLTLEPLGLGGEGVGEVAADVALVDEAGQPAGAGQHAEQRDLGERHGRGAVVDEHDLVAGQGELVTAAGGGAVDGRDPRLPRQRARLLDRVAGLVGELAEVDLVDVRGAGQHLDVGAGAEHLVERAGEHDGLDLGVLEAQSLHDVVELDVDGEVVRVELELVVAARARRRA